MWIVYLDQNHWIRLAQAQRRPSTNLETQALLEKVEGAVLEGTLCLPLTEANIYETYKVNRPERRRRLALLQSNLSRGYVFVGRHERLAAEISDVVRSILGLLPDEREERWFLSRIYFEAFAEHDDVRLPLAVPKRSLDAVAADPSKALFRHLVSGTRAKRLDAVRRWSSGSEELRQRAEHLRAHLARETMATRRKYYRAALMMSEVLEIFRFSRDAGASWRTAEEMGTSNARRLMREVPAYAVETEMALRLMAHDRPLEENDFRDMATFCAVIPYADCVISEKLFANLAVQTRLDRRYKTRVTADLMELAPYLSR